MDGHAMLTAATALLEGMTDDHRTAARSPIDDPMREVFMYWPREMSGDTYPGIGMHHLSFDERKLVMRLVATGVEWATLAQIAAIMALDVPLDASEQYTRTTLRDPLRYWITIFGEPSTSGVWGWQFEGHHVAINYLVIDGEVVSATPLFLGANPARVTKNGHLVSRPCGPEEDAGRTLLAALDPDSRSLAVLDAPAPIDMVVHRLPQVPQVTRPGDNVHPLGAFQHLFLSLEASAKDALTIDLTQADGVARAALDARQKELFDDLVGIYLNRLPQPMAEREMRRLEETGLDALHFAWAGSDVVEAPHYYRIQGPTLLIEYDCVQDGANHTHAVWRDPNRDFGRDPLREHRAASH